MLRRALRRLVALLAGRRGKADMLFFEDGSFVVDGGDWWMRNRKAGEVSKWR